MESPMTESAPAELIDLETIEQARLGSDEALGRLIEACRGYLMLVADREMGRDLRAKAGISDVVQDTLLRACCKFPEFRGESEEELLAWVRRILSRQLSNVRRYYVSTTKRTLAREVVLDPEGGPPPGPGDGPETPFQAAIRHEEADHIRRALGSLPTRYRQVLVWRHWEDKNFKEIAALLGCSIDAARMTWHRAVEQLARRLDPDSSQVGP
jgi:RNA polymerase sigma-70 factor (ECF subfamily)